MMRVELACIIRVALRGNTLGSNRKMGVVAAWAAASLEAFGLAAALPVAAGGVTGVG